MKILPFGKSPTFEKSSTFGKSPTFGKSMTFGKCQTFGKSPAFGKSMTFGKCQAFGKSLLLITSISLLPIWGCKSSIKEPDFIAARNFTFGKMGLKESNIGMDLYYYNPNSFKLQLKKAELDVYLENRFVGKTILDTLLDIPPKDTFTIPVKMGVDMKNLFPNLITLALKEEVELKVEGTVRVMKSGISLNIPVHYTGKHKIVF